MMEEIIHFGIVGCGVISKFHFLAIERIEDARLAGVFDVDSKSAEGRAAEWGCKAYGSYEEMLKDPLIDAVCICTPSGLHARTAMQALEAGKHVLVEKPVSLKLSDCDDMIKLSDKMGLKVGVISQLRFSPAVKLVKKAAADGILGRITRADLYMKYYRPQEYYDSGVWRGTVSLDGGGALMNQGIHGVDLIQYLMGNIKSIYAESKTRARDIEVEDTLSAVVEFQNGAVGVIEASTADYPGFPRKIEINGEYGTIILEEDRIVRWTVKGNKGFEEYENKLEEIKSCSDPESISAEGHLAQMKDFISGIREDTELLVDAREGRKAVRTILAAYQSSEEKKRIVLKEEEW